MIEVDLLLLDGDELLYKACAGFEHEAAWDMDKGIWTTWTETDKARDQVLDQVEKAVNRYEATTTVFCLSGDADFRNIVDPTYKGERKKTRKPTGYVHVRDAVVDRLVKDGTSKVARYDTIEADDCMGILASKPGNEAALIISQDKDMRQIPGMLAAYIGAEPHMVTELEGNRWFLTQTLIGDATDGYKGCPGVGPVKAEKLFDKIKTTNADAFLAEGWKIVEKTYIDAGLTPADALQQARLARILRWSDWDYQKKEPKLWTPPSASSA